MITILADEVLRNTNKFSKLSVVTYSLFLSNSNVPKNNMQMSYFERFIKLKHELHYFARSRSKSLRNNWLTSFLAQAVNVVVSKLVKKDTKTKKN